MGKKDKAQPQGRGPIFPDLGAVIQHHQTEGFSLGGFLVGGRKRRNEK